MKKDFSPKSRKDNLVVQELDGEVLIYDLENDKAFCLNMTSALVWQVCDGNKSVPEIIDYVGAKLNSKSNEDLVWLALDQFKKEKLIENGSDLNNHFEGLSRREVIKKIGLGSMIALPIVTSLIAPTAAYAASICGVNNGMTCTCPNPPCPASAPAAPCVSATCSPASPSCICQGPFACINTNTKQGMCA